MVSKTARAWVAIGLFSCAALAQTGGGQTYPSKPIRIIVPFPAGGPSDVGTRVIAQRMSEDWAQQVLVDNRPGANTIIGAEAVAKSAPDGYTLLTAIDSTLTMNQFLYSRIPYDPIKDFAPVTLTVWSPVILVVDALTGPKSVREIIEQAKASPGKLNYGTGTITTQLVGELFKRAARIDITHVPYKGSPGTVQGLLSQDVRFIIDGVTASVPHIRSGKFRALANFGSRSITALPGTPAFAAEAGLPGFDVGVWLGLVAPAGTPAEIIAKLQEEVARTLALPDVKEKLATVGLEPMKSTPAEFASFIGSEAARWSEVIKQAGIHLE
jgi:tripartite-type tricarboxylate transporter receptor subunit TctC